MTDRALVYLLLMRLKNWAKSLLRRPSGLLGAVLLVAVFVFMAVGGGSGGDVDVSARRAVLGSVLGLYLLLAFFGGLGEAGIGFRPADLDYVLPGPFRRRDILVYHLMRQYLQVAILAVIYVILLGAARLPNPGLAYVGTLLCLIVAAHLQLGSTLLASVVGDQVYGRMRHVSRSVLLTLLVVAAVLAFVGLAGGGDIPGMLTTFLASWPARVLLYPAIAAGRLASAATPEAIAEPLGGLIVCVGLTFGLVLLFPVNFLETSYTATDRRRKRHEGPIVRASPRGASRHVVPRLLRGAASVVWLNAITLRRRLRMVVGLVAMLLIVMLISGARAASRSTSDVTALVGVLAFFPLIANLPLGFRGNREHLELFKTLPLSPTRLALAQVAVPVLLIAFVQGFVIVAFTVMGRLPPEWLLVAFLGFPVLDLGVIALVELFQIGRDPQHMGFLHTTIQMLTIVVSALPAVFAGALVVELTASLPAGIATAILVHLLVDVILVRLLGWRFARFEVGKDDV